MFLGVRLVAELDNEQTLIADAVAGDRIALQQLLLEYTSEVRRYVSEKIPIEVQGLVDGDDIVQHACIEAFRSIQGFQIRGDGSFVGWFKKIAMHRLQDAVKAQRRVKRGGGFRRVNQPSTDQSRSLLGLVELLSAGIRSPSRSARAGQTRRFRPWTHRKGKTTAPGHLRVPDRPP